MRHHKSLTSQHPAIRAAERDSGGTYGSEGAQLFEVGAEEVVDPDTMSVEGIVRKIEKPRGKGDGMVTACICCSSV